MVEVIVATTLLRMESTPPRVRRGGDRPDDPRHSELGLAPALTVGGRILKPVHEGLRGAP